MKYDFKATWEFARVVFLAVAVFALTAIVGHPDYSDWREWLPVVGAGCLQAGAAAALAVLTLKK